MPDGNLQSKDITYNEQVTVYLTRFSETQNKIYTFWTFLSLLLQRDTHLPDAITCVSNQKVYELVFFKISLL